MVLTWKWQTDVAVKSFGLVGMAELFDKTWFVALLMSIKYEKNVVFWGCFLALVAHTLIAVGIGFTINRIFPISVLHFSATALYTFFAFLYLKDWHYADPDSDIIEAGKAEVGDELEENGDKEMAQVNGVNGEVVGATEGAEEADEENMPLKYEAPVIPIWKDDEDDPVNKTEEEAKPAEPAKGPTQKTKSYVRIFTECWMAMFIAEWGDRTQIAMIGQHASQPIIPVCVGSLVAFFLLTVSAVMVGMCLDGMKLSEKKVHLVSSLSFFIFAALALWDGLGSIKEPA